MKKLNKRGIYGLEGLPQLAVIFLVTGVVFGLAMVILASIQATSNVAGEIITVSNESFTTPISNTTYNGTITLAHTGLTEFTSINNRTIVMGSGNYSVTLATGVVKFILPNNITENPVCYNGSTCYATYKYENVKPNVAANSTIANTITAVSEIPNNWLLLIAIVLGAAFVVVITVGSLFGVFGGRGPTGGRR